jgi:peptidoglycan/LPS O-acetylase OafA/YrhL
MMGASVKGLSRTILDHYRKPRVLGLDLLRITASLSIILHHGNLSRLVGQNGFSGLFADDGYLAVDIFFVLSGWLLTRQVLRMRTTITHSMALAVRFWTRRWARTLPPYWIVLVLMFIFAHQMMPEFIPGFSLRLLVTHALFLQTILPPNVFGVSWSLVTEEWFYLLLPFVMLLAVRVRSWRVLVGFGLAALLLPTVIRSLMLLGGMSFLDVRVQPQARFEGLLVGALLAAASVAAPWWTTQVLPRRHLLFGMGALLVVVDLAAGSA